MADTTNANGHDNVIDSSRSEPDQSLRCRSKPTTADQEPKNQTNKTAESSSGFQANPKDNVASTTLVSSPFAAPEDGVERHTVASSSAAWESMTKEQRYVHIYTPVPSPPSSPRPPAASSPASTDTTVNENTNTTENHNEIQTQEERIHSATLLGAERARQVQMENIIYLFHGLMALCVIFGMAMVVYYPKSLGVVFGVVVLVMMVLLRGVWGWLN